MFTTLHFYDIADIRTPRIAKEAADRLARRDRAIKNANAEYDGFKWLEDRGINTDNAIYYSHTGQFSFGWRQPIAQTALDGMRAALAQFPFPYEIKAA